MQDLIFKQMTIKHKQNIHKKLKKKLQKPKPFLVKKSKVFGPSG